MCGRVCSGVVGYGEVSLAYQTPYQEGLGLVTLCVISCSNGMLLSYSGGQK